MRWPMAFPLGQKRFAIVWLMATTRGVSGVSVVVSMRPWSSGIRSVSKYSRDTCADCTGGPI